MKSLFKLLIILVSSINLSAQAGYSVRNVNINSLGGIRDMKFIDSTRGIAISHYEIFSTTDAGENWQIKFILPNNSGLEVINNDADSIIVTGFYAATGPSHLSFLFYDTAFQLVNLPNTYNLSYISPIYFNDSMWSTYGTANPTTNGLLVIKGANYRRIDPNRCILDIYDDRISFYNGSQFRYSIDSAKSWISLSRLPIKRVSQGTFQTYYDGDSTYYMHKHGSFLENYIDSSFISTDFGTSWTSLGSKPKPRRFHFIGGSEIVGVDSNWFYYSIDNGFNFDTLRIDSLPGFNPQLWIHSSQKYFSWTRGNGLVAIEKNRITNIAKPSAKTNFSIVPNPASQHVEIRGVSEAINRIQMLDLSGRIIYEGDGNHKFISLNNIPNGIYFMTLYSNTKRLTKKLIIKNN